MDDPDDYAAERSAFTGWRGWLVDAAAFLLIWAGCMAVGILHN